jgi:hypothetical protein
MMTGKGEIRKQKKVDYRKKGKKRRKKKETHGKKKKKKRVGKGRKRQETVITVITEGGNACEDVMQFIVSC